MRMSTNNVIIISKAIVFYMQIQKMFQSLDLKLDSTSYKVNCDFKLFVFVPDILLR
jgi:hypothetical protein